MESVLQTPDYLKTCSTSGAQSASLSILNAPQGVVESHQLQQRDRWQMLLLFSCWQYYWQEPICG